MRNAIDRRGNDLIAMMCGNVLKGKAIDLRGNDLIALMHWTVRIGNDLIAMMCPNALLGKDPIVNVFMPTSPDSVKPVRMETKRFA